MEQTKLAKFLNTTLTLAFLSLVIFAWVKHFTQNNFISIILTAMAITIIATELRNLSTKRFNRLHLKNAELEQIDRCMWQLLSTNKDENLKFFRHLLSPDYEFYAKKTCLLSKDMIAFYPFFESENLTADGLIQIIKLSSKFKPNSLVIFCVNADKSTQRVINNANLKITILNSYETFCLFKHKNIYPISKSELKQKKRHHTFSKSNIFQFVKAKPFAICGLMLYASSFLVPYKSYYIILATICLLFTVCCLLFTQKPTKTAQFVAILPAPTTPN